MKRFTAGVWALALACGTASAATFTVAPADLAVGKPQFSAPHGTGTNAFAYDWDGPAPTWNTGGAPGYGNTSFYADCDNSNPNPDLRYSTFRIGMRSLFGESVAVGDVVSISYWTNKPAAQTAMDWRIGVYTTAGDLATDPNELVVGAGDGAKWYRSRLQAWPQQGASINAPASQWNQWSTSAGTNQLMFYEQNAAHSNPSNMSWAAVSGGTTAWDYSDEEVMMIDIGLGLRTSGAFYTGESSLDGVVITLTGGRVATINLVPEPTSLALLGLGVLPMLRRRR